MGDYINIPINRLASSVDFHFYFFYDGRAEEIGNYSFDDVSGNFQYIMPDSKHGFDEGKLTLTFYNRPKVGWFKDRVNLNMFKFINLMESTLFYENIDQRRFGGPQDVKLFPYFVGIKIRSVLDPKTPQGTPQTIIFPSPVMQNIDLTGYNNIYKVPKEFLRFVNTHTFEPGMAVTFKDLGFRATVNAGIPIYAMESTFVPFAYDFFEAEMKVQESPSPSI